MNLNGKRVLVTGAAGSGVGAGVCAAIREAGGELLVNALSEEEARDASDRYGAAAALVADVSDEEQVEAMFETVARRYGAIDGLVNNAGIGLDRPAWQVTASEYDRMQAVDLKGVWLTARAFARLAIRERRGGSIVNVSSVHAHATMSGYAVYAATKAGVEGLTRGLAVDLGASGIRCNAVAPGYVHSEQNLQLISGWSDDPAAWVRRHNETQQALPFEITPEDCGWATVFLLSDRSRAITGQTLRVDAGTTALLYGRDFR